MIARHRFDDGLVKPMNYTGAQIKVKEVGLCGNLKRMGFTQDSQMRLYGQEFELMSDPIVMANDVVFVDAIEKKTGRSRRVRIPLTIVQRARAERPAA